MNAPRTEELSHGCCTNCGMTDPCTGWGADTRKPDGTRPVRGEPGFWRVCWVDAPASAAIARELNEDRATVCDHLRSPCYLRCGVRRDAGGSWAPISQAERLRWRDSMERRSDGIVPPTTRRETAAEALSGQADGSGVAR